MFVPMIIGQALKPQDGDYTNDRSVFPLIVYVCCMSMLTAALDGSMGKITGRYVMWQTRQRRSPTGRKGAYSGHWRQPCAAYRYFASFLQD